MYYKIRNDVLFRKYQGHGYLADNSEYGYRMLDDKRRYLGEKYVSASGAVMLSMLGKSPRPIDDVVNELSQIFIGVKKCRTLDLSVNVLSNLTLLTDDIISEMKENTLLSVQVSLYSMDAAVHDSITKLSGSFEKTKAGILRLCDEGIPVQISCPIIKQNKDSYVDVLHWGWVHNIAVATEPVIFAVYDHSGRNLENRLSIEEVEDVLTAQMQEGYAESICKTAEDKEKLSENDPIRSVCRYSFCIMANGKVFPCAGWQNNIIGDLNYQTVQEIWETSEKIRELRQIKRSRFSQCVDCKDRGYCTVCMMWNSNENFDGDPFRNNEYRCNVAAITHSKVDRTLQESNTTEE